MEKEKNKDSLFVYIPDDARLNFEATGEDPPTVKHEKRRSNIHNHVTKNLCGGHYGKQNADRG